MSDTKLKRWIQKSREEERRNPEQYLSSYELCFDEQHVWMSEETYDAVVRNCGFHNGTMPKGEFCGKIFLRGSRFMWFGIDTEDPNNMSKVHTREILITSGAGPTRRP